MIPETFYPRPVKSIYQDIESSSYLAAKIWELIPKSIKSNKSVPVFKITIKQWKPNGCLCKVCQTYILQVGFV